MGNLVAERWPLRPVRTKHLTAILTEPGFRHYSLLGTVVKSYRRVDSQYIMVVWVDFFVYIIIAIQGLLSERGNSLKVFSEKNFFYNEGVPS